NTARLTPDQPIEGMVHGTAARAAVAGETAPTPAVAVTRDDIQRGRAGRAVGLWRLVIVEGAPADPALPCTAQANLGVRCCDEVGQAEMGLHPANDVVSSLARAPHPCVFRVAILVGLRRLLGASSLPPLVLQISLPLPHGRRFLRRRAGKFPRDLLHHLVKQSLKLCMDLAERGAHLVLCYLRLRDKPGEPCPRQEGMTDSVRWVHKGIDLPRAAMDPKGEAHGVADSRAHYPIHIGVDFDGMRELSLRLEDGYDPSTERAQHAGRQGQGSEHPEVAATQ